MPNSSDDFASELYKFLTFLLLFAYSDDGSTLIAFKD